MIVQPVVKVKQIRLRSDSSHSIESFDQLYNLLRLEMINNLDLLNAEHHVAHLGLIDLPNGSALYQKAFSATLVMTDLKIFLKISKK